jgi:integrase
MQPEKRVVVWVQRFPDRPNLMLQWHDRATGKRKTTSARTADEKKAEQARADKEYELNNGLHAEPSRITWEAFRELYEREYLSGLRPRSVKAIGAALDRFERHGGPRLLRGIDARALSSFVAALRVAPVRGRVGYGPQTIHKNLAFLRTALGWAKAQGFIRELPSFPAVKVPRKRPQLVPAESFEKLLDAAPDGQYRVFLLCGWLAGLRLSEAFALEWEASPRAPWVDLGRDRIILPAEFAKSDADQWLPLDPALKAALLTLPRRGRKVFDFQARSGRPVLVTAVSDRIIRLAKKAGVRLSMHTLRKGFGCRYAGKVPAQVLQRLMRHSTIRVTMDYYANIDDAVEEAVLGPKRNSSRNSRPDGPAPAAAVVDATPGGERPDDAATPGGEPAP